MSKLSFEALAGRAEAIASNELLNSISGGKEDVCHDGSCDPPVETDEWDDAGDLLDGGGMPTLPDDIGGGILDGIPGMGF